MAFPILLDIQTAWKPLTHVLFSIFVLILKEKSVFPALLDSSDSISKSQEVFFSKYPYAPQH